MQKKKRPKRQIKDICIVLSAQFKMGELYGTQMAGIEDTYYAFCSHSEADQHRRAKEPWRSSKVEHYFLIPATLVLLAWEFSLSDVFHSLSDRYQNTTKIEA